MYSNIQIFDAPYIQANILSHEIAHEHRKNIHRIIIGAEGVTLAEELARLKTQEKASNRQKEELIRQFSRGGFTISMDAFLAIAPEEEAEVDRRICDLEGDIKSKESETDVQALDFPRPYGCPVVRFGHHNGHSQRKVWPPPHETAEKQVLDHIEHNCRDKARANQFIREGLEQMREDCPFCGQDLGNAADLLAAYREYFDETFRALSVRCGVNN